MDKIQRILILHETPVIGGAEKYLLQLAEAAVRECVDVTVCLCESYTPDDLVRQLQELGAHTGRLDLGLERPNARRIMPAFWRLLARHCPDVVLFNKRINWFDFRHMILAGWLKRLPRMVAVEHWHPEPWPVYPRRRFGPNIHLRQAITQWKCSLYVHRLDAIICMSEVARRRFMTEYGYPADRLHVVYNGIDTKRFEFRAESRGEYRRKLGVHNGNTVFLAAGRHSREKGMDILLDAIALLPESKRAHMSFLLAGYGPETESLKRQADALGVGSCVSFLGQRDDMPELLSAADVFVAPSRRESFGLSIAEAMAAERCAIATRVGGVPELIDSESVGRLVAADSPGELASAMSGVAEDISLRQSLGRAAVQRVRERFDVARSMQETLDLVFGGATA